MRVDLEGRPIRNGQEIQEFDEFLGMGFTPYRRRRRVWLAKLFALMGWLLT